MCVSSCTSAACRASVVHEFADGGIITTDAKKPATCGLPSFSDWRTSTGPFSPIRCRSLRLRSTSFPGRPRSSPDRQAAQEPTEREPDQRPQRSNGSNGSNGSKGIVRLGSSVPVRRSDVERWNRVQNEAFGTSGTPGTIGTVIAGASGAMNGREHTRRWRSATRDGASKEPRREGAPRSPTRRAGWRMCARAIRVPLPSFFPRPIDQCRQPRQLFIRQRSRIDQRRGGLRRRAVEKRLDDAGQRGVAGAFARHRRQVE